MGPVDRLESPGLIVCVLPAPDSGNRAPEEQQHERQQHLEIERARATSRDPGAAAAGCCRSPDAPAAATGAAAAIATATTAAATATRGCACRRSDLQRIVQGTSCYSRDCTASGRIQLKVDVHGGPTVAVSNGRQDRNRDDPVRGVSVGPLQSAGRGCVVDSWNANSRTQERRIQRPVVDAHRTIGTRGPGHPREDLSGSPGRHIVGRQADDTRARHRGRKQPVHALPGTDQEPVFRGGLQGMDLQGGLEFHDALFPEGGIQSSCARALQQEPAYLQVHVRIGSRVIGSGEIKELPIGTHAGCCRSHHRPVKAVTAVRAELRIR